MTESAAVHTTGEPRQHRSHDDRGRRGVREFFLSFALSLIMPALIGCADPTGPEEEPDPVREPPAEIFELTHVNELEIPAIVVEGKCLAFFLFFAWPYPDSIRVDGGRLRLGAGGDYEVYYTWRGQTQVCTMFGRHWHRISHGRYGLHGDRIAFTPDTTGAATWPTGYRQTTRHRPTGRREGQSALIEWGSLRLRFTQ